MPDTFTEVSSKSWFSRLKSAVVGVLIGLLLFVVSFPVLWWNEGRAVQTAKSLAEGAAAVVPVSADKIDAANDQKLVHTTGRADTGETLTDAEFGVSATAIKLARKVEMFQWKEDRETRTKRKMGGGEETTTVYTYNTAWSDDLIESSDFKHPEGHGNPPQMPFPSTEFSAKEVTLGAFKLSSGQIAQMNDWNPLPVTKDLLPQVPPAIRSQCRLSAGMLYRPLASAAEPKPAPPPPPPAARPEAEAAPKPPLAERPEGAEAEQQAASPERPEAAGAAPPADLEEAPPAKPQVGDVRISFAVVKPATVSLIAQQSGDSFRAYQTKAGDSLDMLVMGDQSAESMFQAAVAANNRLTWLLRLGGFVLMLVGVLLVLGPLGVLADFIPILGSVTRAGTFLIALVVAVPFSLLTIAIAWLAYRPVLGIGLILLAVLAGAGLVVLLRKKPAAT